MSASETVLIVEDDDDLRVLLEHTFSRVGYEVVAVADGAVALEYLEEADSPPDIIILDLLMPDVDGLAFLRQRADTNGQIPTIVLTGVDDEETLAEAFELGADDYITKPFSPKELVTRANHLNGA